MKRKELEVSFGHFVDQIEDRGPPGLLCALQVSQESEPEEATEADVDGPEPAGDELEVDGGEEGPDADARLGGKEEGKVD